MTVRCDGAGREAEDGRGEDGDGGRAGHLRPAGPSSRKLTGDPLHRVQLSNPGRDTSFVCLQTPANVPVGGLSLLSQRGERHQDQLRRRGLPWRLPRPATPLLHPGVQPAECGLAAPSYPDLHCKRYSAQGMAAFNIQSGTVAGRNCSFLRLTACKVEC